MATMVYAKVDFIKFKSDINLKLQFILVDNNAFMNDDEDDLHMQHA